MQISIHEIKYQVDVPVIFSSYNILKSDDVLMASQLLQKDDLSESPLSVSCVLESIEVFLKSNDILCLLVYSFPDNTVCSFPYTIIISGALS